MVVSPKCSFCRNVSFLLISLFFLLFSAKELRGQADIVITEISPLIFPTQIVGFQADVTVAPSDPGAAQFSAIGEPNEAVSCQITPPETDIITGSGHGTTKQIELQNFVINAPGHFDSNGVISSIRVGVTAKVKSNNTGGYYLGMASLKIIYH